MALPRLTLFGRSILLMIFEISANAICWIVAGVLFGRNSDTRPALSLALLAWPLTQIISGDPPDLCAIDNATRGLISLGRLAVTCGLYFSLGHSTIVVVVNVAIAISSDVYNKINGVGQVGSIVGAAVSGSFLFIIGLANTIILWKIIKRRRQEKNREQRRNNGEIIEDVNHDPRENHMLMMRILGPVITFVNRPWKMYPVGVLFGFGFDTASSIALLAVSALARKGSDGSSMPSSHIVILPFLFTAGMTLVDSADSILMLYSYTGFPERSLLIFSREPKVIEGTSLPIDTLPGLEEKRQPAPDIRVRDTEKTEATKIPDPMDPLPLDQAQAIERDTRVKMNVMSGLSIILTLMSILVAFSISLITIMGLIGEQCGPCRAAAEAGDGHGGGLTGRWWRGWAKANDQSGFIGVAIVGTFLLIVVGWYGSQRVKRRFNWEGSNQ